MYATNPGRETLVLQGWKPVELLIHTSHKNKICVLTSTPPAQCHRCSCQGPDSPTYYVRCQRHLRKSWLTIEQIFARKLTRLIEMIQVLRIAISRNPRWKNANPRWFRKHRITKAKLPQTTTLWYYRSKMTHQTEDQIWIHENTWWLRTQININSKLKEADMLQ